MPMASAFDLCRDELVLLARQYHTTYNMVNYAIFIVLFLSILFVNVLVAGLARRVAVGEKTDKSVREC